MLAKYPRRHKMSLLSHYTPCTVFDRLHRIWEVVQFGPNIRAFFTLKVLVKTGKAGTVQSAFSVQQTIIRLYVVNAFTSLSLLIFAKNLPSSLAVSLCPHVTILQSLLPTL
jgi:hypothetical protein